MLIRSVEDYIKWLERYRLGTPEIELRLHEAIETLRSDKITIAFVAEFSRGKTELINAIFFADYKRRLLPSEVGRTTMCPTELLHDDETSDAYIRLLPIETRLTEKTISEFKHDPNQWIMLPLDIHSPDQMAATFREVVKVKRVTVEEAKHLGLYSEELISHLPKRDVITHVDIPMWRHAIISFPHPMLKQGLVILDTPGLNALGTEPELTINTIPNAHAVVFVLGADTGVTRTDLDIWQYHITKYRSNDATGLVATLNKIDMLWDEMKEPAEVEDSIEAQRRETGKLLGIDPENVFPVSAQKGLVAKSRQDHELLKRSRLQDLDTWFADKIIPIKQKIVFNNIIHRVSAFSKNNRDLLALQLESVQKQLIDLHSLASRNKEVLQQLTQKTRERQAAYNNNVKLFQTSKRALMQQAKTMTDELSIAAFDQLISKTRRSMMDSWTTSGLKNGMKTFFDGSRDTMQVVTRHAEQVTQAVASIYRKFHEENEMPHMKVPDFSLLGHVANLEELYHRAEEFRDSPVTTMTEQSYVVKNFFISLVTHAREIFVSAHRDAEMWVSNALNPLISYIEENKSLLEKRMETLCKINDSSENLGYQVKELEDKAASLKEQLASLDAISHSFQSSIPAMNTKVATNPDSSQSTG